MNFRARQIISNNSGFTLVELAIVLTVLVVLVGMSLGPGVRLIRWQRQMETQGILTNLSSALGNIYQSNAWLIDSSNNATFNFSLNGTAYVLSAGPANTSANLSALQAVATYASLAFTTSGNDSMNNPMQVYVSNQLADLTTGVQYHVIAIVSPGWDGQIDADTSFNVNTGALNLGGDDMGFVLSGWQYELANMQNTITKLGAVRDSYQNYFTALYQQDSEKNIYVDRFADADSSGAPSGYWDGSAASTVINSQYCLNQGNTNTISNTGVKAALGLTSGAATSAWGQEFLVDNDSSSTRNPDSMGAGSITVPFTAAITAALPWGGAPLQVTVTGLY